MLHVGMQNGWYCDDPGSVGPESLLRLSEAILAFGFRYRGGLKPAASAAAASRKQNSAIVIS